MLIRFESPIAGAVFAYSPGQIVDWPDDAEAQRFVERGYAEQVSQEDADKSANRVKRHKQPEKAVSRV